MSKYVRPPLSHDCYQYNPIVSPQHVSPELSRVRRPYEPLSKYGRSLSVCDSDYVTLRLTPSGNIRPLRYCKSHSYRYPGVNAAYLNQSLPFRRAGNLSHLSYGN